MHKNIYLNKITLTITICIIIFISINKQSNASTKTEQLMPLIRNFTINKYNYHTACKQINKNDILTILDRNINKTKKINISKNKNNIFLLLNRKIKKYTLSGNIIDKNTGEDLPGASLVVKGTQIGSRSNSYGYYYLSLKPGIYKLTYSFIGYDKLEKEIHLSRDTSINIKLHITKKALKEVVIRGKNEFKNIRTNQMSLINIPISRIESLPTLMGEKDVLKIVQMLAGIKSTSEGSSGFSVRGGNPDQNLILLEQAPIYNASHLMGFFSVFNSDAIRDIKLYKGDIPAIHGGRISSVLEISMKDGNTKTISGKGGIGSISSRLSLEGPIGKKTSFIVSARRTYADIFLKLSKDKTLKDNILYFYDLNAKLSHILNNNNRLFLSTYIGSDIFANKENNLSFGNKAFILRWNHLFTQKLFSNTTFTYSSYRYTLQNNTGVNSFKWNSNIKDYSIKTDFTYFLNPNNTLKFGFSNTLHKFKPGHAKGGESSFLTEYKVNNNMSVEQGLYISNNNKISDKINIKYGLRFTAFHNIGPTTIYNYDSDYNLKDSITHSHNKIYNSYFNLEPRVGIKYIINNYSSLKLSYTRTTQYMQKSQNSTGGMPLDVWFSASPNVKPQSANQYVIGYYRNLLNNKLESSVEIYYKNTNNAIDFKDFANLLLNKYMESQLRSGSSKAYGIELTTNLEIGKIHTGLSYTYSISKRKIKHINKNKWYFSPYDRPHDIKLHLSYKTGTRSNLSCFFTYSSGSPVSYPTSLGIYKGSMIKIYSERNSYRLADYHRMDISFSIKSKIKKNRKWQSEWNISLYNLYGRKNPWIVSVKQDKKTGVYAEKTYLFTFIPSITYNFKF